MTDWGYRIYRGAPGKDWGEVEEMLFDDAGRQITWTPAQVLAWFRDSAQADLPYRLEIYPESAAKAGDT